jgi:hypothetical protein
MNQAWTAGVFTTTPAFASIHRHVCVLETGTNRLIAVCGSLEIPESVVLAHLLSAAPELHEVGGSIYQHLLTNGTLKRDTAFGREVMGKLWSALQKADGIEETKGGEEA